MSGTGSDLAAALGHEIAAPLDGDLGGASDRLDQLASDLSRRAAPGDPTSLSLTGRARMKQRAIALAAWSTGDITAAERALLRHIGFAPPTRASGDIEKPLPADPRHRRLTAEVYAARVRALTGGIATAPPPCCAETTRLAATDPTGFAAITLPAGLTSDASARASAFFLSPLDNNRGFVPCGYGCEAARSARAASLAGKNLNALRGALALRLLRLAPGIDILVTGPAGKIPGSIKLEGLFCLFAAGTPPLVVRLVESLVVRRLLVGTEMRVDGDALDAKQGLVFVKMLHRTNARWLDLKQAS